MELLVREKYFFQYLENTQDEKTINREEVNMYLVISKLKFESLEDSYDVSAQDKDEAKAIKKLQALITLNTDADKTFHIIKVIS